MEALGYHNWFGLKMHAKYRSCVFIPASRDRFSRMQGSQQCVRTWRKSRNQPAWLGVTNVVCRQPTFECFEVESKLLPVVVKLRRMTKNWNRCCRWYSFCLIHGIAGNRRSPKKCFPSRLGLDRLRDLLPVHIVAARPFCICFSHQIVCVGTASHHRQLM